MRTNLKIGVLLGAIGMSLGSLVALAPAAQAATSFTVSAITGLKDGQVVNISGSGWGAGAAVVVLECADVTASPAKDCDLATAATPTVDGSGNFNTTYTIKAGKVGNGYCPSKNGTTKCSLVAATSAADAKVQFLDFAPALDLSPKSVTTGSAITATGLGLTPLTEYTVLECANLVGACDGATIVKATTDAGGSFTTNVTVHTGVIGGPAPAPSAPCVVGGTCYIFASNAGPPVTFVSAPFKFVAPAVATKTTAKFSKSTHKITGTVKAAGKGVKGLRVTLERKSGTKWIKVSTLTTKKGGVYTSAKLKKSGSYKALTKATKAYKASSSKVVKVKV